MYILSTFMYGADSIFLKPVLEEFGCTRAQWGITTTIWMLGTGLIMPVIGKLYEKVDGRIMQGAAAVGTAIYCAIRALSKNIYWWWGGAVLLALVFPMVLNLMLPTFTTRWFAKRPGLIMSICSLAQGLSNTFFATFGSVQIANHGWRYYMWMQAALALIIGLPVALLFRSRPQDLGLKPWGYEEKTDDSGSVVTDKPRGFTCKEAMRTPLFWILFAALGLGTLAGTYGFVNAYLQTEAVGYTIVAAGVVVSSQSLGQTVGKASLGTLSDFIGPKRVALLSYTCAIVGILGIAILAPTVSQTVVCVFAFLVGINLAAGNLVWPLVARETFGNLEYTAIWANLVRALAIVGAFASTIWGFVIDYTGSYKSAFFGGTCLYIVPLVALVIATKSTKAYQAKWHE